jgi:hypothetical protein
MHEPSALQRGEGPVERDVVDTHERGVRREVSVPQRLRLRLDSRQDLHAGSSPLQTGPPDGLVG